MKKVELLAISAIALFYAGPAFAQAAPAAQTPAQADDQASDQADDPSQDIVITATKRETTLLDTPIAVSVTTGATIEQAQIRDLLDLQTVIPSLRVAQLQTSANTNFIIRGFGNGANNAGIEPSVGVFIDGVYRSRSAAQIADLPNLKRVEVLRGPQSTLFGKNASAGIISIVTAEPSFKWKGELEGTYGNYNALVFKGNITGPITDTLAFEVSGNFNKRDGYVRDVALNQNASNRDRYGFRTQLLFQPSSKAKFRLIGDFDQIDEVCCAVINVVNGPTGGIVRAIGGNLDAANPFSGRIFSNLPSTNNIKNYGVSLQSDYSLGQFSITSINAYREVQSTTNQDSDFTSADLIGSNLATQRIGTYTSEFRISSDFDGRFNFLAGAYYFRENIRTTDDLTFGRDFRSYAGGLINPALFARGVPGSTIVAGLEASLAPFGVQPGSAFQQGRGVFDRFRYSNTAYSFFGSADFKLTERLIFTGGVNYTNDRKQVSSLDTFSNDTFSALDFVALGRAVITQGGISSGVGQALGLPAGTSPTAAQIGAFAAAQPVIFGQIQAGATAFAAANQTNPAVNTLLGLRAFQFLPPFLNFPNAVEDGRTRDSNVSYSLRLAYKATDNISGYLTYGTGFKASSFNLSRDSRPLAADFIPGSPVTNPAPSAIRTAGLALPNLTAGSRFAGPERARVIEGGIKGQFARGAFNIAAFQQRLTGFQSNIFTGTGFILGNAPSETVVGLEFDGNYRIINPLTLNFALTYLDAKYDSFPGGSAINPTTLGVVPTDLTGRTVAGIAPVSISGGATYTRDLTGNLKLLLRGDYQYESSTPIAEGLPNLTRTVNSLNLSATLEFDNGLELSGWARNATNARYISTVFPSVAQAGSLSSYPNQPATYGGTIRFKF